MKCEIIIDQNAEERVVIYTKAESTLTENIKRLVEQSRKGLVGYSDREIIPLDIKDIFCVTVMSGRVYAICENEKFLLKERLYTLEGKLNERFIKINQSCIANMDKIERFDASFSGTLKVCFKNGHTDYVSRRQLKFIKERFGI